MIVFERNRKQGSAVLATIQKVSDQSRQTGKMPV